MGLIPTAFSLQVCPLGAEWLPRCLPLIRMCFGEVRLSPAFLLVAPAQAGMPFWPGQEPYKSIGLSTGTARVHGLLGNAGSAPTAVFSARRLWCEALLSGMGCSVRQRDRVRLCGQGFRYGRGVMTALSTRKTLWN